MFQQWKVTLSEIAPATKFVENISDEDTNDEEFFFFLNFEEDFSFYVFNDNWGMGIAVHRKEQSSGSLWYFEDLGIETESRKLDMMLIFMKDVLSGRKIFRKFKNRDIDIDFSGYNEIVSKYYIEAGKNESMDEINNKFE